MGWWVIWSELIWSVSGGGKIRCSVVPCLVGSTLSAPQGTTGQCRMQWDVTTTTQGGGLDLQRPPYCSSLQAVEPLAKPWDCSTKTASSLTLHESSCFVPIPLNAVQIMCFGRGLFTSEKTVIKNTMLCDHDERRNLIIWALWQTWHKYIARIVLAWCHGTYFLFLYFMPKKKILICNLPILYYDEF